MNTATAVSPTYKPQSFAAMAPPLPRNLDAERNVLGAVLLDNQAIDAATALSPDDFFLDQHRRVFTQMVAMSERHEAIDLVTLTEALHLRGDLEAAGGAAYIASLADGMPKVSNVPHYAKIVKENAHRRSLIHEAERIQQLAYESEAPGGMLLDQAAQAFRDLAIQRAAVTDPATPEERLKNVLDDARIRVGTSDASLLVPALQSELRHILPEQDYPAPLARIAL